MIGNFWQLSSLLLISRGFKWINVCKMLRTMDRHLECAVWVLAIIIIVIVCFLFLLMFRSVQSLSCVRLFVNPWPPCPSPTPGVHPNPCPSTFISVSSLDFILLYLDSILHTAARVIFIKCKNDHDLTPLHVCTLTTLRMFFPLIFEWLIPFYLDIPTFIVLGFKNFFDCAMWHMGP